MAENVVIQKKEPKKKRASSGKTDQSLFAMLERVLSFESLLDTDNVSKYFFRFLWLIFLGIVYIYNTHVSERMVREADKLKKSIVNKRTEYMTLHSDVMFESKESEVFKKVREFGLEDSHAPMKLVVPVEKR